MTLIPTYRGYVNAWECDEMGHMNVQFYVAKTSDASFHLRAALGLGRGGTSYVLLEQHLRFLREMRTSDLVAIGGGVVEMRERTATLYQEMTNALTGEVAATFTGEVGLMDLATRRIIPWADDTRRRAEALATPLPDFARPRGLTRENFGRDASWSRAQELGLFESNRSAVNPWECDTNGHMNARFYMARFSECQGHLWAHLNVDRHWQKANAIVTATTEYRVNYRRELAAGETIVVMSGVVEAAPRFVRFRHWLFEAEAKEPSAIAEGIAVMLDATTRRAIDLPERLHERVQSGVTSN